MVCLLLAAAMGSSPARAAAPTDAAALQAGRTLYAARCSQCHGAEGKGDGYAADLLSPRPRDFTTGLYKLRETASGEVPTDEDLFRTITRGMPGTTMPAWEGVLKDAERWQLVAFVKTFSENFKDAKPARVKVGRAPGSSAARLAKGKTLYRDNGCFNCHGDDGRGDGPSALTMATDSGEPIVPANLRKPWTFRGGESVEDIFRAISTGLNGTPMPSYFDSLVDGEQVPADSTDLRWSLAHYVRSLADETRPGQSAVVAGSYVEGALPDDPGDPAWNAAKEAHFALIGQIVQHERHFNAAVDSVRVRALYTASELTLRIVWDDRSRSTTNKPEEDERQTFADQMGIQFPARPPDRPGGVEKPYFLNGDAVRPVNLWIWDSDSESARVVLGKGMNKLAPHPDPGEPLRLGKVSYSAGQWQVVVRRSLTTAGGKDATQFGVGRFIPIAFNVWDGGAGEKGTKKAISAWYSLYLAPPASLSLFVFPPLAGLLLLLVELLFVSRLRPRRPPPDGQATERA